MLAGASTACLYPMYTEKSLKYLTENGIKNIEVFLNSHSEMEKNYIKELKVIVDNSGAKITSVHPYSCTLEPTMFFTDYERRFSDILDYYKGYYEAANILGAKYVIFHGNKIQNIFPDEKYFERYEKFYDSGLQAGVTVLQENVARCVSGSLEFEKKMLEQLKDKAKFTLDTKQAVRRGYNPYDFVTALAGHIKHIHISDYDDECDCKLVGTGKLNFPEFAKALKKTGYNNNLILELYTYSYKAQEEIVKNVNYIESIIG